MKKLTNRQKRALVREAQYREAKAVCLARGGKWKPENYMRKWTAGPFLHPINRDARNVTR
jgi:hypothetical protein